MTQDRGKEADASATNPSSATMTSHNYDTTSACGDHSETEIPNYIQRWIDRTRPARQAKIQASRRRREQEAAEAEQRAAKEAAEAVEAAQRAAKAEAEAAELFAQRVQLVENTYDADEWLAGCQNSLLDLRIKFLRGQYPISRENWERLRPLIDACLDAVNSSVGSPAERVVRADELKQAFGAEWEAIESRGL